jgi:hypothetical protein
MVQWENINKATPAARLGFEERNEIRRLYRSGVTVTEIQRRLQLPLIRRRSESTRNLLAHPSGTIRKFLRYWLRELTAHNFADGQHFISNHARVRQGEWICAAEDSAFGRSDPRDHCRDFESQRHSNRKNA